MNTLSGKIEVINIKDENSKNIGASVKLIFEKEHHD